MSHHPLTTAAAIGRLHIVAIAALGTFTFGWLLTGIYPWLAGALCALDWFLVNLLNRVVDLREDEENQIAGTELVRRWQRPILVAGLALLVASLVAGHLLAPATTPLRLGYHLLGATYNWRLLPAGLSGLTDLLRRIPSRPGPTRRIRIKDLYFFKNTASASGFVLTVFGYPLAAVGWDPTFPPGISWATVGACVGWFVLFEISYEVIYDLRDAPGDALAGIKTYPVVHGPRVAARIIDGLLCGAIALLASGYAVGVLPWRIFAMVLAPVAQLVLYRRALYRGITTRFCVMLTWAGAALLVVYHLWIAAGLPGVGLS